MSSYVQHNIKKRYIEALIQELAETNVSCQPGANVDQNLQLGFKRCHIKDCFEDGLKPTRF